MDLDKCTKIIEKIAENHIIVKYVLYDSKQNEIVIETKEYGQTKIDEEKEAAQTEFDKWDKMSTELITKNKKEAQTKLNEVNSLQAEMNKKIISK